MNRREKEFRIIDLLDRPADRHDVGLSALAEMDEKSLDSLLSGLEKDNVTMLDALDRWLRDDVKKSDFMRRAPEQKGVAEKAVAPFLGRLNVAEVTPAAIAEFSFAAPPWNENIGLAGSLISELNTHVRFAVEGLKNTVLKEILNNSDDLVIALADKTYEIEFRKHAKEIRSLLDHYVTIQSDRIVRDFVWLVVDSASHSRISPKALSALHRRLSTVFEADAIVERPDQVSASKALESLAKITRLTFEYAPDLIVTTSSGGKIIADFVVSFLAPAKLHHVDVRAGPRKLDWGKVERGAFRRILLIDSTSRTGDTLVRSLDAINKQAGHAQVQATCFAATFEARSRIGEELLFAPIASPTGDVRPPWDTAGTHKEKGDVHFFGVPAGKRYLGPDVFKLHKEFFEQEFKYTGTVLGGRAK